MLDFCWVGGFRTEEQYEFKNANMLIFIYVREILHKVKINHINVCSQDMEVNAFELKDAINEALRKGLL